MKKLYSGVLMLALFVLAMVGYGRAVTLVEIWDGLAKEPHQTLGESIVPVYVYDSNNGVSRAGAVTPFYKFGPFSLDAGLVSPIDSGKTGTPILGGSLHIDQLVALVLPPVNKFVRGLFPESTGGLLDKLVLGFAPVHNFNAPDNEHSLILAVYSGFELKF